MFVREASPASLTESWSFWYGLKDLFTLHKLADKDLTVKTDDVTSGSGDVNLHRRFRANGLNIFDKINCDWRTTTLAATNVLM